MHVLQDVMHALKIVCSEDCCSGLQGLTQCNLHGAFTEADRAAKCLRGVPSPMHACMQRNITSGYGGDAAMQGLLDRICVPTAPLSESVHMRKVGPHYA